MEQAENQTPPLSAAEIKTRMGRDGFPELEKCWNDFCAQGRDVAGLDQNTLEIQRRAHMEPLFGVPALAGLAAIGSAAGTKALIGSSVDDMTRALPGPTRPLVEGAYYANAALLAVAAAVAVQRYVIHPFHKVMANQAAAMLRWPNFRNQVSESERFTRTHAKLTEHGISSAWDDPNYSRCYRQSDGTVSEVTVETASEIILTTFRAILGHKDEALRRHVPGRLTPHLLEGKKTIRAIVDTFSPELASAREKTLSAVRAAEIFQIIRDTYCKPGSEATRMLSSQIETLLSARPRVPDQGIRAAIWARDPWVDLTSQKEFFSSASLRGKSVFESGSKGRLGTFGYLYNPSICCLDFSTRKGRVVRTRMIAALSRSEHGPTAVLFVDGVEGTNSVPVAVIKRAVEDYARTCGFHAVLYNANVHNSTPKNFVHQLQKAGVPKRELRIEAFDASTREYLDAFGLPMQPFEYMYPRGKVLAHVVPLQERTDTIGNTESVSGMAQRFLQKKLLYLFYADAVGFATLASAQVSGLLAAGVAALSLAGLAANEWYQGRSSRSEKRPPGSTTG